MDIWQNGKGSDLASLKAQEGSCLWSLRRPGLERKGLEAGSAVVYGEDGEEERERNWGGGGSGAQAPVLGLPPAHPHSLEEGSSDKSVERCQGACFPTPPSSRLWMLLCRCRRGWHSNDTPCPSLLPAGHTAFFLPTTPWSSRPPSHRSEDILHPMSQRPGSGVLMSLVIVSPQAESVHPWGDVVFDLCPWYPQPFLGACFSSPC